MIPDVQKRDWSDHVVVYFADQDTGQTAAVHLHPKGRASETLHPQNGAPACDLQPLNGRTGATLYASPMPTVLAVRALVLPALRSCPPSGGAGRIGA